MRSFPFLQALLVPLKYELDLSDRVLSGLSGHTGNNNRLGDVGVNTLKESDETLICAKIV